MFSFSQSCGTPVFVIERSLIALHLRCIIRQGVLAEIGVELIVKFRNVWL